MPNSTVTKNILKKNSIVFGTPSKVIGYDIDSKRIEELKNGFESTNEIKKSDLYLLNKIKLTSSVNELREVNVFIVTVPTPIDKFKNPDTSALQNASKMIGEVIKDTDKSKKNFPPIIISIPSDSRNDLNQFKT